MKIKKATLLAVLSTAQAARKNGERGRAKNTRSLDASQGEPPQTAAKATFKGKMRAYSSVG